LIWTLANLLRYSFTLYARKSNAGFIRERIGIAASADGEVWTELPYAITVLQQNSAGLWRLLLHGTLPGPGDQQLMKYIRFTLAGGDEESGDIELGHAFLEGSKF